MSGPIVVANLELPPPIPERLLAFLDAGRTGNLTLDITEGVIVAFKITESGKIKRGVPKEPKYALR